MQKEFAEERRTLGRWGRASQSEGTACTMAPRHGRGRGVPKSMTTCASMKHGEHEGDDEG